MGDDWLMGDNIVGDDLIWDDTGEDDDGKKADKPAVSVSDSDESQSSNQHSGMPTIHNADMPNINTAGEMSSSPDVDTSIPPDDMFAFLDDVHTDDSEGAHEEALHHAGTSARGTDMGDDMIDNLTAGFDNGAGNLDAEDTDIDLPDDVLAAYGVLDEDMPSAVEDNVPPVIAQSKTQADANTVVPQDMRNAMPEEVLADDIQEVLPDNPHDGQHSVPPALRIASMPEGNPPEQPDEDDFSYLDDYLDTLGMDDMPSDTPNDPVADSARESTSGDVFGWTNMDDAGRTADDTSDIPSAQSDDIPEGIPDAMPAIHNADIPDSQTVPTSEQDATTDDATSADDSPWGDFDDWNLPEPETVAPKQPQPRSAHTEDTGGEWWSENPQPFTQETGDTAFQHSDISPLQNASIADSQPADNTTDGSDPWSGFYDSGDDEESDDDPFAIPETSRADASRDNGQSDLQSIPTDASTSWWPSDSTSVNHTEHPAVHNDGMPAFRNASIMNDDMGDDYADDEEDDENRRRIIRIIIIVIGAILGVTVLAGAGWIGYTAYVNNQQEQAQQAAEQERQNNLEKAQASYQDAVAAANTLIQQVGDSPVADDESLKEPLDAVNSLLEDKPSGEKPKPYSTAADKLDDAVDDLQSAYTDAMQALLESRTKTLSDLIGKADGLGDAPDSDDKKRMQELAADWRDRLDGLTVDDLSDVDKAVSDLQSLTDKVQQAKTDEENRKAQEEAQKQAEQEAQQQAQQQQSYTPDYSYVPYYPPQQNYTPQAPAAPQPDTTPQEPPAIQQPDTSQQHHGYVGVPL